MRHEDRERLEDEAPLFERTRRSVGDGHPAAANKGRVKRRLKAERLGWRRRHR